MKLVRLWQNALIIIPKLSRQNASEERKKNQNQHAFLCGYPASCGAKIWEPVFEPLM